MKKITIAIDGHSSCGKSTMAKDLAKAIGYVYVDTGAMYRAVTLYALRNNLYTEDGEIMTEELQAKMPEVEISMPRQASPTHTLTANWWKKTSAEWRFQTV